MDQFWLWTNNLSGLLGILTTLLAGYSAFMLWRQNRRLTAQSRLLARIDDFDQLCEQHKGVTSSNPVALALSLTPNAGSISRSVQTFIDRNGWHMEILEVQREGVRPTELKGLVEAFREKRRFIDSKGYTEIHVFFSGPVAGAILFGGIYDNWMPVKLYQKLQASDDYEYWCPLFS